MSHVELSGALKSLNRLAEEVKEVTEHDQLSPPYERRTNSNEKIRNNAGMARDGPKGELVAKRF